MKKLLLASAALTALFGGVANAADMGARPAYTPPPPAYSWTGLYYGANIGYSWGESRRDTTLTGVGTFSRNQDIDGVIGGLQTGYNYQFGTWVWGFESDIQASGQKGGETFVLNPITTLTTDHKLEWLGTARSRLGVLWTPYTLLYGTFGIAYGQVKDSTTITQTGVGSAPSTFKDWKAGWTAGAGVETAFGGGWSGKLEYLYVDLGKTEQTLVTPALGQIITETRRTTDNIVRVGLNYKWGGY